MTLVSQLLKFVLLLSFFTCAEAVTKESFYKLPEIVAVDKKQHDINHDFTFNIGLLPSDVFNKGYLVGASYSYFFKSYLGWEVFNVNYSFNQTTQLNEDIKKIPDIDIVDESLGPYLEYIEYYLTTNLIYTPFYTKNLLFNESIIHGDQSIVIGGGVAKFAPENYRIMVDIGLMLRFFLPNKDSIKFDFRNNIYFLKAGIINTWSVQIGYSFLWHGNQKKSEPVEEEYFEE